MNKRQLRMFAASQLICLECRVPFVGLSKDVIKSWAEPAPFTSPGSINWAVDRTYQENIHYCSVECLESAKRRAIQDEIARLRHKQYGRGC